MNPQKIALFHPASKSDPKKLHLSVQHLQANGFKVEVVDTPEPDQHWPYTSNSVQQRLKTLTELINSDFDILWSARGGYGVSDLLPLIDWPQAKNSKPKTLIGFSDISALLLPAQQILGWQCLHAPMPGTTLWQDDVQDISALLELLKTPKDQWDIQIDLEPSTVNQNISGKLYGGCFSVLTNLIGTPYFKAPAEPWILFMEDTDESAPRLMRYWNQWQQSGYTQHLQAIVVGNLRNLGSEKLVFLNELSRSSGLVVRSTELFGHVQPNMPMLVGADCVLDNKNLNWTSFLKKAEGDKQC